MTALSNQFTITPVKGQLTGAPNWDTLNCIVDANQASALVPGQAVLIKDVAGAQIPVEDIAAVGNDIFGFVTYSVKKDSYGAGEQIKIAKDGDIMYMEASAAIARGADVEVVISGNKVATQSAGTTIGKALDKAAADGDLIRVLITV